MPAPVVPHSCCDFSWDVLCTNCLTNVCLQIGTVEMSVDESHDETKMTCYILVLQGLPHST